MIQVAIISMMLSFLQNNRAPAVKNLATMEQAMRMITLLLQATGDAPYMRSLKLLWQCGTNALTDLEERHFPGEPIQTPQELYVPNRCSAFTALKDPSFQSFHF